MVYLYFVKQRKCFNNINVSEKRQPIALATDSSLEWQTCPRVTDFLFLDVVNAYDELHQSLLCILLYIKDSSTLYLSVQNLDKM